MAELGLDTIVQTTSSGLRVVGVPLPHLHQIVLNATLHVGARYESEATSGLSHFLEHMLFRGTPSHRSSRELANAFESLGGSLTAATGTDTGTLSAAVPPESFSEMLPVFAEVFRAPLFSDIETEKGIVREEILESLGDDGTCIDTEDLIRRSCFRDHALGLSIIGTTEHLDGFDVAQLTAHHRSYYCAAGTIVSVAGPLTESHVSRITQAFEGVPRGSIPTTAPPPEQSAARFEFVRNSSSQTELRVGFRAPAITAPDEPAMELLMRTLDDGMSTRLYAEICDKRGLCYDVGAEYEGYADAGIVEIGAECTHENAEQVLDAVLELLRRLRDDGPTPAELDKAKRRHRWDSMRLADSADGTADHFALGMLQGVETDLVRRVAQIDALGVEDLRSVAQRWWQPRQLNVVAVGLQPKRAVARLSRLAERFS